MKKLITQMTKENKNLIKIAVETHLHRYGNSHQEMLDHAHQIAELTGYNSGFFGISFPLLIDYLREKINVAKKEITKHSDES